MRRVLAVIACGALGLTLITPATGHASTSTPSATAQRTAETETSPRNDDGLDWGRCGSELPTRARCASLEVPRDWAEPTAGPTYRIRVARIAAPRATRIGVLTYNTGGPGGTGVDSLGSIYDMLPESIRQRFDVVGWDPRGTGRSQPRLRLCAFDSPNPPPTGPVDWEDYTQQYVDAQASAASECLERNPVDSNYVGTWQVIRDLDALRVALGERQISFWGMSYGTTIGRAYAQAFPSRLRALVLDGTISPAPTIASYSREHIWDDVTGVDTMLGALGPSYVRTYDRAMRYLDRRTLKVPGWPDPMTRWDLGGQLVGRAAYQSAWDGVMELLDLVRRALNDRMTQTDSARLEALFADVDDIEVEPFVLRQGGQNPQYFYVNCSDMPDRPTAASLARTVEQAAEVGGVVMGLAALGEGSQCAGLPEIGRPLPGLYGIQRLGTPPVVINSVSDNRTPWLGARQTANHFAGSSMVTYAGTQHVSYGRVSACITRPVTTYLLTLQRPARSVACPLAWG